MKRILLDTSVYGELIEDLDVVDKIAKLIPQKYIIYGTKLIRNELRAVSRKEKIGKESKRKLVLYIYDLLIKKDKHDLKITDLVEIISNKYYVEYNRLKGGYGYRSIINDFKIIACASLHNLDIVISRDMKSMLGEKAIKSYETINKSYQIRTPEFITYKKFREAYLWTLDVTSINFRMNFINSGSFLASTIFFLNSFHSFVSANDLDFIITKWYIIYLKLSIGEQNA